MYNHLPDPKFSKTVLMFLLSQSNARYLWTDKYDHLLLAGRCLTLPDGVFFEPSCEGHSPHCIGAEEGTPILFTMPADEKDNLAQQMIEVRQTIEQVKQEA